MSNALPENVLAAVKVLCTRQPAKDVPPAIKLLREQAGLSQEQLASQFNRRRSAVANWESSSKYGKQPPAGMTMALLRVFNIPQDAVPLNLDIDLDLDSRAYAQGDPDVIEYRWFLKTRGQVLNAVKQRAADGSAADAKLFKDWMRENEAIIVARKSVLIDVKGSRGTRNAWQRGKPSLITANNVSDGTTQDVVSTEDVRTEEPLCDIDTPQDVDGVNQSSNVVDTQADEG